MSSLGGSCYLCPMQVQYRITARHTGTVPLNACRSKRLVKFRVPSMTCSWTRHYLHDNIDSCIKSAHRVAGLRVGDCLPWFRSLAEVLSQSAKPGEPGRQVRKGSVRVASSLDEEPNP